jgi:hypothetical protein
VGFLHARETMEVDRKKQPDVNSLWPNPWLLIALHSPNALVEIGLRMCCPEKS